MNNTDFLAHAMMMVDGYRMMNEQTYYMNVYDMQTRQGLSGVYRGPESVHMNIPKYYSRESLMNYYDTSDTTQFELIDGKNGESYAKCVSDNIDKKTFLIALKVDTDNSEKIKKIAKKIDEIIQEREKEDTFYLVIFCDLRDVNFDMITNTWLPINPHKSKENMDKKDDIEESISYVKIFVKTRKNNA